jgi:hypothetical protein
MGLSFSISRGGRMNTSESKELAKKLTGKEVIEETIEGVILEKSELPEEISMFLEEEKDYLAYLNPLENDDIVTHILLDEKLIVSFLINEDGIVKEVFNDNSGMA